MRTRDETILCKRYVGSDIGVIGRFIWVRMSQKTLSYWMHKRDKTILCMCHLGSDICVHALSGFECHRRL